MQRNIFYDSFCELKFQIVIIVFWTFFAPQIIVFVNVHARVISHNYRNLKSGHWRSSRRCLRGGILDKTVKLWWCFIEIVNVAFKSDSSQHGNNWLAPFAWMCGASNHLQQIIIFINALNDTAQRQICNFSCTIVFLTI